MKFVGSVLPIVENLPNYTRFNLLNQIIKSLVSIPSNISEGCSRSSNRDFVRFLEYSLGSGYELETQILISTKLGYVSEKNSKDILEELHIIQKQLVVLIRKVKTQ